MQRHEEREGVSPFRVGMVAELSLGYNVSGMYVQLVNLRGSLSLAGLDVRLYDMWNAGAAEYDLLHIFGLNPSLFQLVMALDRLRIPYVVSPNYWPVSHVRANRILSHLDFRDGVVASRGALQRRVLMNARQIIVASSGERDALARAYRLKKACFVDVPNAVEKEYATGDPSLFRRFFGLHDDFVLTVSEVFNETKNHLRLLKAWTSDMPRLVFIGNQLQGEYADRCRKEALRLGNVTVVGPLPHGSDLLRSAYRACSAFVLPSLVETTGLAALEAAVAGAPIAITQTGGTKSYFRDDAHYCNPRSSESIRRAVVAALESGRDEERAARYLKWFGWDEISPRVRSCYETALRLSDR